jgi:hypothetical protein
MRRRPWLVRAVQQWNGSYSRDQSSPLSVVQQFGPHFDAIGARRRSIGGRQTMLGSQSARTCTGRWWTVRRRKLLGISVCQQLPCQFQPGTGVQRCGVIAVTSVSGGCGPKRGPISRRQRLGHIGDWSTGALAVLYESSRELAEISENDDGPHRMASVVARNRGWWPGAFSRRSTIALALATVECHFGSLSRSSLYSLWPLVMVMDRAHCANKESCYTLRKHLVDPETADFVSATKGLLMIWSCRNDAKMTEFMAAFLSRCTANLDASGEEGHSTTEHGKCAWHNIELSNLTRTETDPWIKEFLCREECPKDRIHPWSEFVYEYARGHPQPTRYILSIFKLRGWISRSDNTALPDLERTPSCGELFRCTLEQQDALVQSVVLTVIAIRAGDEHAAVTLRVLDMVQQQSCAKALLVAEEYGLLESIHGYYQLTNQELQEEVYSLLTVSKRLQTHLWIGRRLWKHSDLELNDESMSSGDDASMLPIIAQQLQLGSALVKDAQERNVIALIHWYAGKNALKSSLFTRASAHFEFAISVLKYEAAWSKEPATWSKVPATWSKEHYAINLALYNNAAEAHFCLGDYLSMGRMVETVPFAFTTNYQHILRCCLEEELSFATKKPLLWLWICGNNSIDLCPPILQQCKLPTSISKCVGC